MLGAIVFMEMGLLVGPDGKLGWDYSYFLPLLFQGKLQFIGQGIVPPLYSLHFCGATPGWGNPQSMFYSIPQFLSFFLDPFAAVRISLGLYLCAAATGTYLLLRQVFNAPISSAVCGALTFSGSGYFYVRALIGHITFLPLSLSPLLFYYLLRPTQSWLLPGIISGSLGAYFVHSGAVLAPLVVTLSFFLTAALLVAEQNSATDGRGVVQFPKVILLRLLLSALVAAALCASKLVAVYSTMKIFPRVSEFDELKSMGSLFEELRYSLLTFPLYPPSTLRYGVWEYAANIPFFSWIGIFAYLFSFRLFSRQWRGIVLFTLALMGILAIVFGYPPIVQILKSLPLFSAMRLNIRFAAALLLPLSLVSALGVAKVPALERISPLALTLASLFTIFLSWIALQRDGVLNFDYRTIVHDARVSPPLPLSVLPPIFQKPVISPTDNDLRAVLRNQINPTCYETLFTPSYPVTQLLPGPVERIFSGRYNLNNPACLIYPRENSCAPGDLISAGDRRNLDLLLAYKNPLWRRSYAQQLADILSICALTFCLATFAWGLSVTLRRMVRTRS